MCAIIMTTQLCVNVIDWPNHMFSGRCFVLTELVNGLHTMLYKSHSMLGLALLAHYSRAEI